MQEELDNLTVQLESAKEICRERIQKQNDTYD